MTAFDTSVVVPLLAAELPRHHAAVRQYSDEVKVPLHAALEAFSVLSRLPPPHRRSPVTAAAVLRANFNGRILASPPPGSLCGWLEEMAELGVSGGAIYDAVVAESARRAGAELVTFDQRARATYERVGVAVRFIDLD